MIKTLTEPKFKPVKDELKIPGAQNYLLRTIIESHQKGGELGTLHAKYCNEIEELMYRFAADVAICAINNLNKGNEFSIGGYTVTPVKKKKQ